MNILKRDLAPVTEKSWAAIQNEAHDMFEPLLSARRIIQVEGPLGWDYAAVPTGRLQFPKGGSEDVRYALRESKPLVELRVPFELDIWELDNIVRGAKNIDLKPMEKTAAVLAAFEDNAVFNGLKKAQISGMREASAYKPLDYPKNEEELPRTIAHGVNLLQAASVEGPYALMLGAEKWQDLTTCAQGYPLKSRVEEVIGGPIIVSQNIDGGFLVPDQTEDLLLTLGNDISIGYESHDNEKVKLYFTEAFTFQVLDPSVVIVLN